MAMAVKLLLYPDKIIGGHRMLHYLRHLGVEWTQDPKEDGITHVHNYAYTNRMDAVDDELIPFKERGIEIINENLLNIKKDHVDRVFSYVFGYSIMVDPTKHMGMCFKRSTQNAIHFGSFLQCPIKPEQVDVEPRYSKRGEPHYRIYTRIIDTRISADKIRDFRFVVIGGKPVFLFEKHLDSTCIFHPDKNKYSEVFGWDRFDKFFTDDEMGNIETFLDGMGADFCEIDVLRDNSTGLMYICDVNPVPGGLALTSCQWSGNVIDYLANIYKKEHLS